MKHIIMTGITGFVGSWFAEELLKNEVTVTALVRDRKKVLPSISAHKGCRIIECDYNKIGEVQLDSKILYDAFYHLGWGGVSSELKNDIDLQLSNIFGSMQAMQLSNRLGCGKFIASGTVAEYVFCEEVMDVYQKQTPNDMYGAAKVSTHYFLEVLSRQLKHPFIWTVLPSTFGERRTDNNIITYTIQTLLKGEKPTYGNLDQMWDFLYVSEVARALRMIGERGIPGRIYGIGSGVYMPLKEYIFRIRENINPQAELGIGERHSMSEQTFSSCVNIHELTDDTGFVPEIAFDEGIMRTIEWFKRNTMED